MCRVVIAHQTDLVLIGARTVLDEQTEYGVLAAVSSLGQFIEALQIHQPEVMVVQAGLEPGADLLWLVEQSLKACAAGRLIVLGHLKDGLLIRDLLRCGGWGYLYESDDLRVCLPAAVETVLRGRPYLSPTASTEYLVAMQSPLRDATLDAEARVVLRLLARGLHTHEIAVQMAVPQRRVYWVRQKLRRRFGANTNEHLISLAASEGFVHGEG